MKKFRYVVMLLALACVAFAFSGVLGCNKSSVPQVTISGFTLTETSLTVDAGDEVFVSTTANDMQVVGSDGKTYEVYYEVTTKNGGYVDVSRGFFFADDTNGYIISYKVITSDNRVHTLTQDVNVVGVMTLRADYDTRLYAVGDTVTVVPVCNYANPAYEITAIHDATGTPVTVSADKTFVVENVGWYTITITATAVNATPASFEYSIYARDAFKTGEVESFDESWAIVRQLEDYGTHGWVVKDTEEIGIKNRFGQDDTLLASTKQAMSGYAQNGVGYYFVFWLNARADREYYKSLVDQGYTYLSVWAYLDVEIDCADNCNHIVSRVRGGTAENAPGLGSTSNIMGTETLYNAKWDGAWTEFKVRLVDLTTQNDKNGSFNTSYDYYKEEWYPFIRFETSNSRNHGAMSVYIDDIYAVKEVDLAFNDDTEIVADVNDTVDFADYVNTSALPADADLIYSVSVNGGEYTALEGSTYTIPAIGAYKVKVGITNQNYKAKDLTKAEYTFIAPQGVEKGTVLVDKAKLSGTYDINSMLTTEEAERIANFGTLTFKLTDAKGNETTLSGASINLANVEETFYTLTGLYGADNVPVWTATIDFYNGSNFVWRNPQTTDVADGYFDMLNGWAGEFGGTGASLSVVDIASESYNTDSSKTGNFYRFDYNMENFKAVGIDKAWGLKVAPQHTKEYYQLFIGSTNVKMEFDYMIVKTDADATETPWILKCGYGYGNTTGHNYDLLVWQGAAPKEWKTGWIDLDYFVANNWHKAYGANGCSLLAMNNTWEFSDQREEYNGNFVVYIGNFRVSNPGSTYLNEYYLYNPATGTYELDETLSETATAPYDTAVTFNQKVIEGYAFNPSAAGNVLTGTTTFGETLVLKGYYNPAINKNFGIRTGDTLDIGVGEIENYTVTQYYFTSVLNPSASSSELNTIASLDAHPVDVTAKYPNLFDENGIANTSAMDGVYTISIFAKDGSVVTVDFEQYKEGVFTWNNLDNGAGTGVMSRYDWNGAHNGGAVVSSANSASDANLANLLANGGYNGKANPDSNPNNFWKVDVNIPSANEQVAGLRVYPVHTWEFYNTYWNGASVQLDTFAYDTSVAMNKKHIAYTWTLPYVEGGQSASVYTDYINGWRSASFVLTESNYARLTNQKTSGGNPHMAYFYSVTDQSMQLGEGPLVYYVGNFKVISGYNTEYYTQQDDGSFELAQTVFNKADVGATVNAKLDYAIENYTYAVNADEVLTATVVAGSNYVTMKVYYVKTNVPYTVEHYVWSDALSDYELADTETLYGTFNTTAQVTPKTTYENALYTIIDGKSVESGVVTLDGSLVLKAYYAKAITVTLADADGFYRADSLNLGSYLNADIASVKVEQFIVTNEGNVAVDVTDDYVAAIDKANKTVDLTSFDGIYTVTAKDVNDSAVVISFERVIDGVLTWNNLDETGHDQVAGAAVVHGYDTSKYAGDGVIESVDANDPILEGRTGVYYKMTQTYSTTQGNWGLKVYPVHTKAYYEAFGSVELYVDYYIVKNGAPDNDVTWIMYHHKASGAGTGMEYQPLVYAQHPNSWGTEGTAWNHRTSIDLAGLVQRWEQVTDIEQGGGLFGFWNQYDEEDFTGKFTVYFGNVHTTTGYKTEYYTQQDDGNFALATTTFTRAAAGATANAKLDYAIENYTYAVNAGEVLTGTVNAGIDYTVLKVYYVKSNVPYTVEHYKWNAAESKYDLYEAETKYGVYNTTAEFLALNIEGYALNVGAEGSVLSGTIALDGSLVLKGYYNNASQTNLGIRTGDTLDFGVGEVESYTVTQYYFTSVLNPSETASELNTIKELTPNAVNVTANYPDLFDVNGVADTSKLDGVYTITAIGKNGSTAVIDFEQYQEGVFTWNNLAGAAGADLMARYDWAGDHTGDGVISSANAENDETLAGFMTNGGYNGKANPTGTEGNYWKVDVSIPELTSDVAGLRVYPVHTWDFYNTYWNGATVEFNTFAYDTSLDMNRKHICFTWTLPYVTGGQSESVYTDYINAWRTASFALTESNYARLTNQTTSGGNPHMAYFYSVTNQSMQIGEGPLTYYVGNFNAVMGYNTEYYTQQDDGSFELAETVFTKAKAGTTANAKLDYAIENYTYAANAGEVLTGTVTADPANYVTLKVYYVKSNVPYTVEHYVWSDALSDFDLADSETLYGTYNSTVAVTPKTTYAGAVFAEIEGKSVTSGVVTLDGALVLKAYYPKASTVTLADADGFYRANSLNLGDYLAGDIVSVEIDQYVVTADGNVAVDVTDVYAAAIDKANKTVDLTALDGIFTITAQDSTSSLVAITFERVIASQFTWNNINEFGSDKVVGASVSHGYLTNTYVGDGVLTAVNEDDTVVAGREGNYWKLTQTYTDSKANWALKIFPVHTKAYYEAFGDSTMIVDYYFDKLGEDVDNEQWNIAHPYTEKEGVARYIQYSQDADSWGTSGSWRDRKGFAVSDILNHWDKAIATNNSYGGLIAFWNAGDDDDSYEGKFVVYFGNVHLINSAIKYDVEIYTFDKTAGEYVKNEENSVVDAVAQLGQTVSISESLAIEGYALDKSVEGTVASGVIGIGEKLVLKAYYVPAIDVTIEGLRSDATLDFGIGAVESYTVKQYTVSTTNATKGDLSAAGTIGTVSYEGVDVTANYPNLFDENGVADTSKLDGIYKITAKSANGTSVQKFEQYKEGVFTWNNIYASAVDTKESALGSVVNAYIHGTTDGQSPVSATVETVDSTTDAELESYMTSAYGGTSLTDHSGTYFKFVTTSPLCESTGDGVGVRVNPAHSWNYYNTLWANSTISYNALIKAKEKKITEYAYARTNYGAYMTGNSSGYNAHTRWHDWVSKSFELNENFYVMLSCTNYGANAKIRAGSLACFWGGASDGRTGATFYVGGFTVTPTTPAQ